MYVMVGVISLLEVLSGKEEEQEAPIKKKLIKTFIKDLLCKSVKVVKIVKIIIKLIGSKSSR